jgi:hypothetical protein
MRQAPWLVGTALGVLLVLGHGAPAPGADPLGRLTGTVTGVGAPQANAWVTLTPVDHRGSATGRAQRTSTDGAGRYAFPDLPVGRAKLEVRAPLLGDLVDTYWPRAFTFADAGVIEVTTATVTADVDLPAAGSVEGQVVHASTGAPVVGARVTARIAGDGPPGTVGAPAAAEGPGRFSLTGLPPVPVELSVWLPPGSPFLPPSGGGADSTDSLHLDGGERTTGVIVGLRRAAEITGTVRDDAGAAVSGALIRGIGCLPTCPPQTTSDASGRYRLVGVAPGTGLGVVAVPSDEALGPWYPSRQTAARVTDLTVAEGDIVDSVDLTLPRAAFVSVEVRGAGRVEPLRAIVRLTTSGRTYSQYFAGRAVDDPAPAAQPGGGAGPAANRAREGSVRLRMGPVPPGDYSLSVSLGVADAGYLPSRWVTESGTPSAPTIRLSAGQTTRSVILLARAEAEAEPAADGVTQGTAEGWPGLARGFLGPASWLDARR